MARRGGKIRTVYRTLKRQSRRRPSRSGAKALAKKAAIGAVAGLAVSVPLTLLAKHTNNPILMEVGQRGGSVLSAAMGGAPGNAGYQIADAAFDRFVVFNGGGVSGTPGNVYL